MATFLNNDTFEQWVATVAHNCGDLVQTPSGRIGIVNNAAPVAIGDLVSAERVGRVEVPNPDSLTFTQGVQVGYDATAKKVTAAGLGDFDIGMIAKAYPSAKPTVQVFLNEA